MGILKIITILQPKSQRSIHCDMAEHYDADQGDKVVFRNKSGNYQQHSGEGKVCEIVCVCSDLWIDQVANHADVRGEE